MLSEQNQLLLSSSSLACWLSDFFCSRNIEKSSRPQNQDQFSLSQSHWIHWKKSHQFQFKQAYIGKKNLAIIPPEEFLPSPPDFDDARHTLSLSTLLNPLSKWSRRLILYKPNSYDVILTGIIISRMIIVVVGAQRDDLDG